MKERFYKGGCNYTPPRETSVKNNVGIRRVKAYGSEIGIYFAWKELKCTAKSTTLLSWWIRARILSKIYS